MAQDTQIFCGCKPTGLCLTIIRVPVGAFELAGSDDVRLVAEEHAEALPGRVLQRGNGYAVVEWHEDAAQRAPQPHSRRAPGAIE
ncbi:MAG TPA: hypothetical protein VF186_09725 [Gaiellaceae bacterium]